MLEMLQWVAESGEDATLAGAPPWSSLKQMEFDNLVVRADSFGNSAQWRLTGLGMYELTRLFAIQERSNAN